MPLITPVTPVYGPNTFTDLAALVTGFRANDDYLKTLIDAIVVPAVSRAELALASGYTNNSSYVNTRVVKTGNIVTIEAGAINCPASFSAGTYYTLGTVPVGYRQTDAKHRMGVGAIFNSTNIQPIQYRINSTNGEVNFYSVTAVAGASYIILAPITWDVGA